jgi:hypothetical protein
MNLIKSALVVLLVVVASMNMFGQSTQQIKLGDGQHVARILEQALDLSQDQIAVVSQLWIDSAPVGVTKDQVRTMTPTQKRQGRIARNQRFFASLREHLNTDQVAKLTQLTNQNN